VGCTSGAKSDIYDCLVVVADVVDTAAAAAVVWDYASPTLTAHNSSTVPPRP